MSNWYIYLTVWSIASLPVAIIAGQWLRRNGMIDFIGRTMIAASVTALGWLAVTDANAMDSLTKAGDLRGGPDAVQPFATTGLD